MNNISTERKIVIVTGILLFAALVGWVFFESFKSDPKNKPGQSVADLGREHIDVGKHVDYNSNPPTSGPHYVEWTRKGVYDQPKDDRNLIHSLEHGYVIVSYNCQFNKSVFIKQAYAHEEGTAPENPAESSESANLSPDFNSTDCQTLKDQLVQIYTRKGENKLIVVYRPNLNSKIALTAWNRIDKFNDFDEKRIEKFIDGFRNQGPEQTLE